MGDGATFLDLRFQEWPQGAVLFTLPPEAKFVLVATAGVAAAFTVGWMVTRSALLARFV